MLRLLLVLGSVAVLSSAYPRQNFIAKHAYKASGDTRVTDDLKLIVVVSRHGNRGGTDDYPFDPYPINNTDWWPYGINQLTTRGRQQMHKLGAKVRTLYDGFLSDSFHPEELYAASTAEDRTLMSGEAFLSGLYPPTGFQLWDKNLKWQPVSLYSNSSDKTPTILSCKKFQQELFLVVEEFLITYGNNITTMIKYFNKETGLNASGLAAAKYLYHFGDKLISEATEGYKIPQWTKVLYPNPLLKLIGKVYLSYFAGTFEQVRLVVGTFLADVVKVLLDHISGELTSSRKIHYYSGHDSSLVTLQVVLGLPTSAINGLVRPGSAIILELHQNASTNQYHVEPLYIDGSTAYLNPQPLYIPACNGTSCDLDNFLQLTQNYTNVDYEAECDVQSESEFTDHLNLFNPFL